MFNSRILLIFPMVALLLISACAPPAPPSDGTPAFNSPQPSVATPETENVSPMPDSKTSSSTEQSAQEVAAGALNVAPETVTVLEMEEVFWSDSSLGCPQPGIMYAQVITPGYKATVEVEGETYNVHLDASGRGVVCMPEK